MNLCLLAFPLKKIPPRADVTRRTRRAVQINTEEERLRESGAFYKTMKKEILVKRSADGERYTTCSYQHSLHIPCQECLRQRLVEIDDNGNKIVITEDF